MNTLKSKLLRSILAFALLGSMVPSTALATGSENINTPSQNKYVEQENIDTDVLGIQTDTDAVEQNQQESTDSQNQSNLTSDAEQSTIEESSTNSSNSESEFEATDGTQQDADDETMEESQKIELGNTDNGRSWDTSASYTFFPDENDNFSYSVACVYENFGYTWLHDSDIEVSKFYIASSSGEGYTQVDSQYVRRYPNETYYALVAGKGNYYGSMYIQIDVYDMSDISNYQSDIYNSDGKSSSCFDYQTFNFADVRLEFYSWRGGDKEILASDDYEIVTCIVFSDTKMRDFYL